MIYLDQEFVVVEVTAKIKILFNHRVHVINYLKSKSQQTHEYVMPTCITSTASPVGLHVFLLSVFNNHCLKLQVQLLICILI